MLPQIFVLYCEEQRRIEIVIATGEDMAFKFLAIAEDGEDAGDEEPDIEHYKKYWRVLESRDATMAGALIGVTHEYDEGYQIHPIPNRVDPAMANF